MVVVVVELAVELVVLLLVVVVLLLVVVVVVDGKILSYDTFSNLPVPALYLKMSLSDNDVKSTSSMPETYNRVSLSNTALRPMIWRQPVLLKSIRSNCVFA